MLYHKQLEDNQRIQSIFYCTIRC